MEYIDLLNSIIQAEQNAQKIADEAQMQRQSLPEDLQKARDELHDSYFSRAQRRLDQIVERENALADERIAELDAQFQRDLQNVNNLYAQKREEWISKLYAKVMDQ